MPPPLAELRSENGTLVTVLAGDWKIGAHSPHFDSLITADRPATTSTRSLTFDASRLGEWDSSLLIFLAQARGYAEAHQLDLDRSTLPEPIGRLLALSEAVPERSTSDDPGLSAPASVVTRLGTAGLNAWSSFRASLTFTGEVAIAMSKLPSRRVHMRWREFWVVVQDNSSGALPIVTLIALLIGVIIAFLGVVVLERFGAGYYASYLVGFGVLREMGALMTGIIMAGRTSAGFAAELGSMKINEEIDAFVTLGISPVEHLVVPRMLGIFFMMPLLTLYADFVGIVGGMAVAVSLLNLSTTQFIGGLLTAVTLSDAIFGVFKGVVFGLIIGFAGCLKGLQAGSDAGAVGRAATSAVVLGITLIILANAVVDWLAALLKI
jgi:phospholipid/cholesterol/gamma-HCH transport system permease protein